MRLQPATKSFGQRTAEFVCRQIAQRSDGEPDPRGRPGGTALLVRQLQDVQAYLLRQQAMGAESITSLMPSLSKCSCSASRPTSSREYLPVRSVPLARRTRRDSAVAAA